MLTRAVLIGFQVLSCLGSLLGAPDVMRVHFIDVGQGSATLVELPTGSILIDTGGERWPEEGPAEFDSTKMLIEYLQAFYSTTRPELGHRLDLLVLTHPHIDHTRGVKKVLELFRPKNVIHNGQRGQWPESGYEAARRYVKDSDARGHYVLEKYIPAGGLTNRVIDPINPDATDGLTDPSIRALWGQVRDDSGWDPVDYDDENNHSLVLRIDFGKASILFTGDLETAHNPAMKGGIERLLDKHAEPSQLDVDVYHVGHHGSHNGTTAALLQAMRPKIAVISAGPALERGEFSAYSHGHPRTKTIAALEPAVQLSRPQVKTVQCFDEYGKPPVERAMRKAIYSTGWDGTVVLEAKPSGWWDVVRPAGGG